MDECINKYLEYSRSEARRLIESLGIKRTPTLTIDNPLNS